MVVESTVTSVESTVNADVSGMVVVPTVTAVKSFVNTGVSGIVTGILLDPSKLPPHPRYSGSVITAILILKN